VPDSDHNDDIENRVAVLERQFLRLREQVTLAVSEAAAARLLAAGADHDVSEVRAELRAHIQALNALRETQLELDKKVTSLDDKVTKLDDKVTHGFGTLSAGMAQIMALLKPTSASEQS
jgi:chromosome segregation ATPase